MPDTDHPLKVFLCHASQDKSVVRELSRRLIAEGWIDVWLDEKKLLPGQDWRLNIEEAVENSDNVIICLSSNSVTKEGFVQKELRYAREIALEKPEDTIFLIPLRLDDCSVPRGLRFYQWADYFGEKQDEAYRALIEALQLRYVQRLKIEEEKNARQEKEKSGREIVERETGEKDSRVRAERDVLEKATREKAAREKLERESAKRAAHEEVKREATEKHKNEMAMRQSYQTGTLTTTISETYIKPKTILYNKTNHYVIILLVLATAVLHLAAAYDRELFPNGIPDPLFLLNGLGYLSLLGIYFLPISSFQHNHASIWLFLFGYVILTIVAWLVIWVGINVIGQGVSFFSRDSIYGVPAKIVEVILLILLWKDRP
jgi:TIR domain